MKQPASWRATVVPAAGQAGAARVVVVEAAATFGWERVAGREALLIGVDRFGASAPWKTIADHLGLTGPRIADRVAEWIGGR